MAVGGRIGVAFLGLILGSALGAGIGLLGGLAWTTLAGTSSFEGYSGFVVAFWMLGGLLFGMVAGPLVGWAWSGRRAARSSPGH